MDGVSDGGRATGAQAADKWRHLREVLRSRTKAPLVVDQGGATVVGSVRLGIAQAADRAQADRDLSAISACWNCADDLVSDLGRERAEAERLRRAVALALDGPTDAEIGMETTLGRLNRIERQLRVALAPDGGGGA